MINLNSANYLQVDYGEIERRNTITFGEFKMWLQGLITGKSGAIPDFEDWKKIKKMMDKVYVPASIIVTPAAPPPAYPFLAPSYPPINVPMSPINPFPPSIPWITCGDINKPIGGLDYDTTKLGQLGYDPNETYGRIKCTLQESSEVYIPNTNDSNNNT